MYTLGDIPRKGAKVYPDKTALVFERERLTFKDLNERVNRFANALIDQGCKKGDRLAILSENTHKYIETYFAAAKAGMSVTPLNFRLSKPELIHITNDSEATVFLVGDGYEAMVHEMKKDLINIRLWINMDHQEENRFFYEDMIKAGSPEEPDVPVEENELVILMYTGGTTGLPKGVMLSHRNLLTSTHGLIIAYSLTRHDVECFILPLFHVSFWPVLCVLMVGGTAAILRRPELQEMCRVIQDERCTHIVLVPTLLVWLLDLPNLDDFDLSSLRIITYAGSPMPIEVLRRCMQKFGNIFAQGYGLTEAAPIVTVMHPEDHILEGLRKKLLNSVGKEGAVVEVQVVDSFDNSVKPGRVGEIAVRGKNVMLGYWKNPELTEEALRGGWLHTGDMGTTDEEGYIYLMDRKADMIVTGGENVYPKETEDVLYTHPAVQECAVTSAPDEKWGERVQAVVVKRENHKVSEEELIKYCKEWLAGYKCPKKIEFWENLPKTPVGKILRKDIKAHFWKESVKLIG